MLLVGRRDWSGNALNLLGMGPLEILAILLVAFTVLGPERMVDAGRQLGKVVRQAKRLADELPKLSFDEPVESPMEGMAQGEESLSGGLAQDGKVEAEPGGPVSFRPDSSSKKKP